MFESRWSHEEMEGQDFGKFLLGLAADILFPVHHAQGPDGQCSLSPPQQQKYQDPNNTEATVLVS